MSTQKEQQNKALMATVAHAFKHGDLRLLKEVMHDEIVWKTMAPVDMFRFGGARDQRLGATESLALIFATYLFQRFEPKEIIAENDLVWGLFEVEAVYQPTGAVVRSDVAIRYLMRDGKIIEHETFFDTASVLMQQGQPTPSNPPDTRQLPS